MKENAALEEAVRLIVATAPPLSPLQRDRLRALLKPVRHDPLRYELAQPGDGRKAHPDNRGAAA